MTDFQPGDTATCTQCNKGIEFDGCYWNHTNGKTYRHPPWPRAKIGWVDVGQITPGSFSPGDKAPKEEVEDFISVTEYNKLADALVKIQRSLKTYHAQDEKFPLDVIESTSQALSELGEITPF